MSPIDIYKTKLSDVEAWLNEKLNNPYLDGIKGGASTSAVNKPLNQ